MPLVLWLLDQVYELRDELAAPAPAHVRRGPPAAMSFSPLRGLHNDTGDQRRQQHRLLVRLEQLCGLLQ